MSEHIGTVLLYGGIAGMILFFVIGVVCWIHLSKKRKKLLHVIETEYK